MIRKSLYLFLIPQFDVIVKMSFFRENEIDLAGLETGIIEINESKISMIKCDMNLKESPESMKISIIKMIFRKTLKKKLKCNEIEELYLVTIWEMNDDMEISISASQNLDKVLNWIREKYGTVLREELSS